jgi:glycosyltransferase involved in cell wall biosynthesis
MPQVDNNIAGAKKLAITHIITGLTIGGAQQLLLNLCLETLAQGHQVRVIGLRPGVMAGEFRRQGIPVEELALQRMVSLSTLVRLMAILKRKRPDLVHTHLGRADSYGRVAAAMARVPVTVSTVHNVEQWKDRLPLRWIDAATATLADHLIACSDRVAEHLRKVGLVPMKKVSVIRNGIRLGDWIDQPGGTEAAAIRQEFHCAGDDFVMGAIGRLEPQKGHQYLFHALAVLRPKLPEIRLWVVGDGTLRESLERLATELDLLANVRFVGNRRDMRSIYAALDLVVMPSLWEGLPIALLEAMACRRPIIATSVGGIPEVIQHEVNGILVPPKDGVALAVAIERSYRCRPFTHALAEAGFQTVARSFSIADNARMACALYEKLAGRV